MLQGVGTIFHALGAIRNDKSVSHGKNYGDVGPTIELAQTLNHLAGVCAAFMLTQTTSALEQRK